MKTLALMSLCGLLAAAPLAAADVVATVTSSGTIAQYAPGTSFVLTEPTGPITYAYGPQVVYTTTAGTVIPATEVRSRIHVGTPVDVHYVMQGDRRIINRVIVRESDVDVDDADDDDDD